MPLVDGKAGRSCKAAMKVEVTRRRRGDPRLESLLLPSCRKLGALRGTSFRYLIHWIKFTANFSETQ